MELFDSHCHLDVAEFDADRDAVLARSRAAGVVHQLVPAIDAHGWERVISMCTHAEGLYPALGLHPVYINQHRDADLECLEQRVAEWGPVAIGEIGLDFFIKGLDRDRQQQIFEAQLAIAHDANLPVVLHIRKAHDQVLNTLRRLRVCGGIAHAFNGSLQQAGQYIDLGFKLGFGGMLTYERSSRLRTLARALPLTSIVLETDAPDLTPQSHRGERNSPEYLPEVLQALSEVRNEAPSSLAMQTTANGLEVLKLNGSQSG